jgi:hypothetical protein
LHLRKINVNNQIYNQSCGGGPPQKNFRQKAIAGKVKKIGL